MKTRTNPKTLYRMLPRMLMLTVLALLAAVSCDYVNVDRLLQLVGRGGGGGPSVHIVVGDVSVGRGEGERQSAVAGFGLRPGDTVAVQRASKVKINAGEGTFFVNGESAFRLIQPVEDESCAVQIERGEYYFAARDGGAIVARFGDMAITMRNADASLRVAPSGRLAEFFVLSGRARVSRGMTEKLVSSCMSVALDAAGISEDEAVTANRANAVERLKGWVGATAIERAATVGQCWPGGEPAGVDTLAGTSSDTASVDTSAGIDTPAAVGADVDAARQLQPPPQPLSQQSLPQQSQQLPPQPLSQQSLPQQSQQLPPPSLSQQSLPQQSQQLPPPPPSQQSLPQQSQQLPQLPPVTPTSTPIVINAGGPYAASRNRPVRLLGNARSRTGRIVRYEWRLAGRDRPDFASSDNGVVEYTFARVGEYRAVYTARLADGATASDTAVITVGPARPVASGGGDIVVSAGRDVSLRGTASSPDSRIVRYEWDFDGDGSFDWSSASTGEAVRSFREFSRAVFRVTNAEGGFASDTIRVIICPRDMVTLTNGKFCADRYEWPNRRGEVPLANVSWYEASEACASVGKRLCTASEWARACGNDGGRRPADGTFYPYDDEFDDRRCNTLGNLRSRNALSPSGVFGDCVGTLSIFDMSGNAAEWVASPDANRAPAMGGFYQSGAEESGCGSYVTLDKNGKFPYVGFRCCK